ncbi:helix-turn-helix domain-containing protein [Dyadobacter fanqingshengii]|uniref:helix-turn-helix domain-containing protein n=1 Tax=Dyadobacter fanqingshengii TaxID=2906443 RepID=UPI0020C1A9DC|nr:helix-turn-helix transcriptional regulator [Dyadobacter fanqingshengii]UTM21872.1 helix-turn-helix domain-containing protein [Dyadobacter fanqingshengii]
MKNTDSNILALFAENIKKSRKEKGLSQEALADLAGLHRTYIGMVERSEKNITLKNIERIAIALKVSIADLLTFSNDN